jgi:hypothetical protein
MLLMISQLLIKKNYCFNDLIQKFSWCGPHIGRTSCSFFGPLNFFFSDAKLMFRFIK